MKDSPRYAERLLACWHPVAYAHELGSDRPHGAMLLDEPVVLWRDSDGQALAMKDVCIHRGTALSLGWLADDCLVCPYHGWRYDENGACAYITVGTPIRVSNSRNSERSLSVRVRVGNRLGPPGRPQSSNAAFTTALSPPVRAHILPRKSDQGQFA